MVLKLGFILIGLIVSLWGFVYELSYFNQLKIQIPRDASIFHYFASGMKPIALMAFGLLIFATAKYLFTTRPQETSEEVLKQTKALAANAKLKGIRDVKTSARIGVLVSFLFYLAVRYDLRPPAFLQDEASGLGMIWYYMAWVAFLLSFPLLYLEETPSKPLALILLIISIVFIYASGGIFDAREASMDNGVIRDTIFHINTAGGSFNAKAIPIFEQVVAFFKIPFVSP